jgi:hypothetical protein
VAARLLSFVTSLLLLMASLGMSLFEIILSVRALDIALADMEDTLAE